MERSDSPQDPRNLNAVSAKRIDSILELAAAGLTDKAIAEKLGLTTHAIDYYWRRIRMKSGSSSRTEAVAQFLSNTRKPTSAKLRSIQSWPGIQAVSPEGSSEI